MVVGEFRLRNLGLGELGFVGMRIKMSPQQEDIGDPCVGRGIWVSLRLQWHSLSFSWGAILLVP